MSKAIKDFVRGMGQALDLGGTMAARTRSSKQRDDLSSLSSDWHKVGEDFERAFERLSTERRFRA